MKPIVIFETVESDQPNMNPPKIQCRFGILTERLCNVLTDHPSGFCLVYETEKNRKALIAEARGILGKQGGVGGAKWMSVTSSEYNRLREILDELERLP